MIKLRRLASLVVCGSLAWTVPVAADAVTDWNAIALAAVAAGRPGPGPVGILDLVLVQAAVHDAVQAIDGRFQPYHVKISGAPGSPAAAAAAAAYNVLVGFYPSQAGSLTTTYQTYLSSNNLVNDPGLAVGKAVADGILPLRRLDPNPPPVFTGGTNPGEWRPTESFIGTPPGPPPSFAPMAAPWLGSFKPFTLKSPTQYRAPKPPVLNSARYAHEYDEVKALGARFNSARTDEQTDMGYFFSDNFFGIWDRGLRAIVAQYVPDIGDSARLFALAHLAAADAVITAWDSKRYYNFWRPLTAVREGDNDTNHHTVGDPAWQPLINTPNYPDYTSGANNVTGAMTRTLELFFGTDEKTFSLTTTIPQAVQKTRTYTRFSDAAQDVEDVRIYQGIHFRSADAEARKQGRQVAKWVFKNFLRPIGEHGSNHGKDGDD